MGCSYFQKFDIQINDRPGTKLFETFAVHSIHVDLLYPFSQVLRFLFHQRFNNFGPHHLHILHGGPRKPTLGGENQALPSKVREFNNVGYQRADPYLRPTRPKMPNPTQCPSPCIQCGQVHRKRFSMISMMGSSLSSSLSIPSFTIKSRFS